MGRVKFSQLGKIFSLAIILIVLLASGQQAFSQEIPNGDADTLWRIKAGDGSADGGLVIHPINSNILFGLHGKIYEYDEEDGELLRTIETVPGGEIQRISFSSDGKTFAVNLWFAGPSKIFLYDYESGTFLKNILIKADYPCFIPNTNHILLRDSSRIINEYKQWVIVKYDIETDRIFDLDTLIASGYPTVSNDGSIFAVANTESSKGDVRSTVSIYNTHTWKLIKQLPYEWDKAISNIRISPKNTYISVSASGEGRFQDVINLSTNERFIYPATAASGLHFTNDEEVWVASSTYDRPRIYVYKKESLQPVYMFNIWNKVRILKDNSLIVLGENILTRYSNKWYLTDVRPEPETTGIIKNIDYSNNAVNIELQHPLIVDKLIITDIEGKILNKNREPQPVENKITIEMLLPSGNYILKLIAQGKEYTSKFVVIK